MSESVEWINKKLIEDYGKDIELNIPKYRIVWTTSQKEKRWEIYRVFTESGIYLREERGVFEVEKYGEGFKDMWVLEDIRSTIGNPYLEAVTKWSYEPIWIFGAANSDRQPLWRAVVLLIRNKLHGDPNRVNKSPQTLIDEEVERMAKEKALCKTILQNDSPITATMVHNGAGIFVPSVYVKQEDSNEPDSTI